MYIFLKDNYKQLQRNVKSELNYVKANKAYKY